MSKSAAEVHFEEQGSKLTAVRVVRDARSPLIGSLHRVLFALGVVVSSYHVRPGATGLVERMVLERSDGGSVDGQLTAAAKAAIMPLVFPAPADEA